MQSMSLTQISRIQKKMAREHLLVVGWGGGGGWNIHKENVMLLLLLFN